MTLYEQALTFALKAHGEQKRKYTGEPYMVHPVEVASILRQFGFTETVLAAALMHDVLEDTEQTEFNMRCKFPDLVVDLVVELTEVKTEGNRKKRKDDERLRLSKVSYLAQNIKVADLISNSRTIVEHGGNFAPVYLAEMEALLKSLDNADEGLRSTAWWVLNDAKFKLEKNNDDKQK